jgi:threonine/homoserine/homoserine lactone efflux protein
MTLLTALTLFAVLCFLAATPSLSVFTVATRTMVWGWPHGVCTSLGIVVGDVCFILLAIFGLGILFHLAQEGLFLLRIMAGIYLIFLSVQLWRSTQFEISIESETNRPSCYSSFTLGLLITLGDQKAIFFYLGFFPLFIDAQQLTLAEIALLIALATLAVGSAKLFYVYLIHRSRHYFMRQKQYALLNKIASLLIATIGAVLIFG